MTEQHSGPGQYPASGGFAQPGPLDPSGGVTQRRATASHALLGPLTLRDLVVLGAVVVMFVGSLLPVTRVSGYANFWNGTGLFFLILGMLLPLAVGVLFLARRLSPSTRLRIGSLSVDQFASVVSAYAAGFFFWGLVASASPGYAIGFIGAIVLLGSTTFAPLLPFFAGDFAGRPEAPAHQVARDAVPAAAAPAKEPARSTPGTASPSEGTRVPGPAAVYTPNPAAAQEFSHVLGSAAAGAGTPGAGTASAGTAAVGGRSAAGIVASAGTAPGAGASAQGPAVDRSEGATATGGTQGGMREAAPETMLNPAVHGGTQTPEPHARPESIGASKDPAAEQNNGSHAVHDAFWFAVDRPKAVLDEKTGAFLYNVEPGNWILALADRGHDFLVQNTDGRVGVLRDLSNIERAPEGE